MLRKALKNALTKRAIENDIFGKLIKDNNELMKHDTLNRTK